MVPGVQCVIIITTGMNEMSKWSADSLATIAVSY